MDEKACLKCGGELKRFSGWTWVLFFLTGGWLIFALPFFNKKCKACKTKIPNTSMIAGMGITKENWFKKWQVWAVVAIFAMPTLLSPIFLEAGKNISNSNVENGSKAIKTGNEKARYKNSGSYLGKNAKPIIKKENGTIQLSVSQEHKNNIVDKFGANAAGVISPTNSITVSYDEIWDYKVTDGLSESEIRQYSKDLDIIRSYWKSGEIQASVVLKKKNYNGTAKHVITSIESRDQVLSNI